MCILVRDQEGRVLVAKCAMKPLTADPSIAEVVGAWLSAEVCHQLCYSRTILEGDSLEIIQVLRKEWKCWSAYGHLNNDTKTILQEIPQWEAHHVRRNVNAAAHSLVKMAFVIGEDRMWDDFIPEFIHDIVSEE